jgi:hypothetical protein
VGEAPVHASSAASRPSWSKWTWATLAIFVVLMLLVLTVAVRGALQSRPSCTIPNGLNGTECYNGIRYNFETVSEPLPGSSYSTFFSGDTFELWYTTPASNASQAVGVNATEPSGAVSSVVLQDTLVRAGVWQTAISSDLQFGAQVPQADISEIRLLVRA